MHGFTLLARDRDNASPSLSPPFPRPRRRLLFPITAAAQHFPSNEDLEVMLRYRVEDRETPGIVLGILEADGSTRIVSYGRPLGPKSVFEIGSITKVFTGTLLADMVERGEVALDDPVAKYLPEGQVRKMARVGDKGPPPAVLAGNAALDLPLAADRQAIYAGTYIRREGERTMELRIFVENGPLMGSRQARSRGGCSTRATMSSGRREPSSNAWCSK